MSSLFTFLLVLALVYAARDQQPGDRAKKPKPKPNKPKPKPTTTTKPQPEHFNPLPSDARQECYDCLAARATVCGRDCFTGDNDIECFSCVFELNPGCLPACGFPAASTQFCSEPNFCPKSGGPGSGSCQEPVTGETPVPMLPTGETPVPMLPTGETPVPMLPTGETPVPVLPTGETPVTMPTVETTGAPGGNGTGLATVYSQPSGELQLKRDTLLTTIDLGRQWQVSFNFKPTNYDYNGWTNVLHMTVGGDQGNLGDRTPAVMYNPSYGLQIAWPAIGTTGPYSSMFVKPPPPAGEWTRIVISQLTTGTTTTFSHRIGEAAPVTKENPAPQEFSSVKVYAANPWTETQAGFIRGLNIKTQ